MVTETGWIILLPCATILVQPTAAEENIVRRYISGAAAHLVYHCLINHKRNIYKQTSPKPFNQDQIPTSQSSKLMSHHPTICLFLNTRQL